ncbi:MAG: LexA family transcriptional regulator [Gammaproteobacteria bacterium]|nr:LexA family transcriptional regulator [Gammaproteobacteria bacterium]
MNPTELVRETIPAESSKDGIGETGPVDTAEPDLKGDSGPATEAEKDPVRERVRRYLWENGLTMREASLAIGRHGTYLHQFLVRGSPKVLGFRDAEKLAVILGCDSRELHHAELPQRRRFTRKGGASRMATGAKAGLAVSVRGPEDYPEESGGLPEPVVRIPEVAMEASAGPGAFAGEHVTERAHWFLPESMVRYEGNAVPGDLRLLRVRGESMEPELSDGDRLVVDTAPARPVSGEMCVLWDGSGLVVKRIEYLPEPGSPSRLRLKSANPDYADYDCLAQDTHLVGRVVWSIRKV